MSKKHPVQPELDHINAMLDLWEIGIDQMEVKTNAVKALFEFFLNDQLPNRLRSNVCNRILSKIDDQRHLLVQLILYAKTPRKMLFAFYEAIEKAMHIELMQNDIHLKISHIENDKLFVILKPLFENIFKRKSNQSKSLIEALSHNDIHEIYEHFIYFLMREEQLGNLHLFLNLYEQKLSDQVLHQELIKQIKLWILELSRQLNRYTGAPVPLDTAENIKILDSLTDRGLSDSFWEASSSEPPSTIADLKVLSLDEHKKQVTDQSLTDLITQLDKKSILGLTHDITQLDKKITPIEVIDEEAIEIEQRYLGPEEIALEDMTKLQSQADETALPIPPHPVALSQPQKQAPIITSPSHQRQASAMPSPVSQSQAADMLSSAPAPAMASPELHVPPQAPARASSKGEPIVPGLIAVKEHDISLDEFGTEERLKSKAEEVDVISKTEIAVEKQPGKLKRFGNWLLSFVIDEDQSKPLDERLASDDLGDVGGVEKLFGQLKFLLKLLYHVLGMRAVKGIHLIDLVVGQMTEYFQSIFRGFKNIKSTYRILVRKQNQSLVIEMKKEILSVQHSLANLWRISDQLSHGEQAEKSEKPSLVNPLTELIMLRDLISQVRNDLDYINVGEVKSMVKGNALGFFTALIPNPISVLTPFKDALIIAFAQPMPRTKLSELYRRFLECSALFLDALAKAHQPIHITQAISYLPHLHAQHQAQVVDELRGILKRLLYHSLNSHFYSQPRYWKKQELLQELYLELKGEYYQLDMITALELEKYLKPLLISTLLDIQESQKELLEVIYPMLEQKSFLVLHGKEKAFVLLQYQEELKLKTKLYQKLFDQGLLIK